MASVINIFVLGAGGREHALCWKIRQSEMCGKLFCAPGNAGIAQDAELVDVDPSDHFAVVNFCQKNDVELVVVGPEAYLGEGIEDSLTAAGIKVFGPSEKAAQLETSKGFMKDLCARAGIPTAAYKRFTDAEAAKAYVDELGAPIVVKADGLAAGKGVVVAETVEDAKIAIDDCILGGAFGGAGAEVVVEEFMDGEEASFFAIFDGNGGVLPMIAAQDHKRVGDGDTGPNTGGMGTYSPAPVFTKEVEAQVMAETIVPLEETMRGEGMPYKGIVFAGLMIKDGKARIVEYNARFGDPECQVLMMRMKSDIVPVLLAAAEGDLSKVGAFEWHDEAAVCVVMAAEGYPASYKKNTVIKGLEAAAAIDGVTVFHAATKKEGGEWLSVGGRVLGVTALGSSIAEAKENAYKAVDAIDWAEGFCRRDIAWRAIGREDAAA